QSPRGDAQLPRLRRLDGEGPAHAAVLGVEGVEARAGAEGADEDAAVPAERGRRADHPVEARAEAQPPVAVDGVEAPIVAAEVDRPVVADEGARVDVAARPVVPAPAAVRRDGVEAIVLRADADRSEER